MQANFVSLKTKLRGHVAVPLVLGLLLLFFFVGIIAPNFSHAILPLSPGSTIMYHFYLWNILTGGLFEPSIVRLLIPAATIFHFGRTLEKLWEAERLLLFVGQTHAAAGVLCFVIKMAGAMMTASSDKSSKHLFGTEYGCNGIMLSFVVAFALEWPRINLPFKLTFSRTRDTHSNIDGNSIATMHLVSAYLGLMTAMHLIGLLYTNDITLMWLQAMAAWTYLRFFEDHGGFSGNEDDHFAFHCFFPTSMRRFVEPVTAIALRIFNCYGCLFRTTATTTNTSLNGRSGQLLQNGSNGFITDPQSKIAERRRLRALRELDAKLAALSDMPDIPLGFDGSSSEEGEPDTSVDMTNFDARQSNKTLLLGTNGDKSPSTSTQHIPTGTDEDILSSTQHKFAIPIGGAGNQQRSTALQNMIAATHTAAEDMGLVASESGDDVASSCTDV